jgi:two-component system OmpR family response regulator
MPPRIARRCNCAQAQQFSNHQVFIRHPPRRIGEGRPRTAPTRNTAMPAWNLCLIDANAAHGHALATYLRAHGFGVDVLCTAQELRRRFPRCEADLVVLDLHPPGADGIDLLRELRRRSGVPVIATDAIGDAHDGVVALELGADDYLVKPLDPRNVLARIRALRRRVVGHLAQEGAAAYRFAGWSFAPASRRLVSPRDEATRLTPSESRLLCIFLRSPFNVLSRAYLLRAAGGVAGDLPERSVDLRVWRLRRKLGAGAPIRTERNAGFVFCAHVEACDAALSAQPLMASTGT